MKPPRDIDGAVFANALRVLGYEITRQKGSHISNCNARYWKQFYSTICGTSKPISTRSRY